jgi:hypothetical protein
MFGAPFRRFGFDEDQQIMQIMPSRRDQSRGDVGPFGKNAIRVRSEAAK